MNRTTLKGIPAKLALGLVLLAAAAAPSFAQDYYLVALEATATLPDTNTYPMWGFIEVADAAALADFDCATVDSADPWAVGPTLTATAGGSLTVNLKNCLADPVSVFIPGQLKGTTPVMFNDGQGRSRVRSFDAETASGATESYAWTGVKEGTYLYHSGTHPQVQVQMGLYGALTVGNYGIENEATLVYSEIDPALHEAVASDCYGPTAIEDPTCDGGLKPAWMTSTFDYMPRYFLINGAAFPDTADITVDTVTEVLLRFVNAGLRTHVPTLEGGLYMRLIAEDGNLYKDGDGNPIPFEQYGVELPPAKTIDAVVNVGTAGTYALYDRALGLTNWLDTGGGMLTYIQAGAAVDAPLAVDDAYTTAENTPLSVVAPGVLGNDEDGTSGTPGSIPGTYEASLITDVSAGSLTLNANGSFDYTPTTGFSGTDLFSYQAVDGAATPGPNSNVATVTITVTFVNGSAPVANDDSATTLPITPVTIDVVANDTDADGNLDPTSANTVCGTCDVPDFGTLVNNGDGTFDYTPNPGTTSDSFVYEVCDTGDDGFGLNALCATATVTIAVVNNPPTANDDSATTSSGTSVLIDVVANDTDEDGNLDPTTANTTCLTGTPVCSEPTDGTLVNNLNGTFTYIPDPLFAGSDSFVYEVCDTGDDGLGGGALCDTATVTITVDSSAPVANDDFATTTRNNAVTFSVTANDVDADDDLDVGSVDLDPDAAGRQTTVTTQRGGTATVDALGDVTFTPKKGFRGTDLFTYTVNDDLGATSNVATVRINVVK